MGSVLGAIIPGFDIPNAVLILFVARPIAQLILNQNAFSAATPLPWAAMKKPPACPASMLTAGRLPFILCAALFAGLGGVLMASRLNSAQPALGMGYELDAIAAVVIGGTSLSGGEGTILARSSARSSSAC